VGKLEKIVATLYGIWWKNWKRWMLFKLGWLSDIDFDGKEDTGGIVLYFCCMSLGSIPDMSQ